mgnify:FL=1
MFKRGVSPVIATVLLLALTVGLASIIFAFVVPFVQDQLGNSKACLKVLDGVEFADSKFNCYSPTETGFSIKVKKTEVTAVRVSFIDDVGNSEVKNIPDNDVDENFRIIGGEYGPALNNFPSSGGQRTYITNKKYSKAEISPVTESGNTCAVADTIEFTPCSPDVVFS